MSLHAIGLDLGIIAAAAIGLWIGAGALVDGAASFATRAGISETVVGLTIVAVGTSAPELAVTIGAAANGQAAIALGNVVGSNVFNLGLLLGGVALVREIPVASELVRRDGPVVILAGLIVTLFLLDGTLATWEGAVLAIGWFGYVAVLLARRSRPQLELETSDETSGDLDIDADPTDPVWKTVGEVVVGLAVVLLSARFLVTAASDLARVAGLAEWLIGLTVVAAGTSMPEFATAVLATTRGRHGVSVGTLLGSDLSNLLLALGLSAVVRPLSVGVDVLPSMGLLVASVVLVVVLLLTRARLTRAEGALLVVVALGRWAFTVV